MRVKVSYTWRQANAMKFSSDKVRRECTPFKHKRLKGFVCKKTNVDTTVIKRWLDEQEIKIANLYGVFTVDRDSVIYDGLAVEFNNEDDALLFKIRF